MQVYVVYISDILYWLHKTELIEWDWLLIYVRRDHVP